MIWGLLLKWPKGFDGCDINDMVRDHPEISLVGWTEKNSVKVIAESKLDIRHGLDTTAQRAIEWVWPNHIRTGTYCSFSGQQGTMKSTIARELAARYTRGDPMPCCKTVGMPAGHILYIHAEELKREVDEDFAWFGGDSDLWHTQSATLKDGNFLNVLEHLPAIEEAIRALGIRVVFIDGQNSVVGAPDIGTDMKGRHNVTNKLHQFAQRLDIALIGLRNEDTDGRALGSQSMADIGRCVMRCEEVATDNGDRYFKLIFKKVSDVSPRLYPPIPYSVEDLGGRRRKILWGKSMKQAFDAAGVGKKGDKR